MCTICLAVLRKQILAANSEAIKLKGSGTQVLLFTARSSTMEMEFAMICLAVLHKVTNNQKSNLTKLFIGKPTSTFDLGRTEVSEE